MSVLKQASEPEGYQQEGLLSIQALKHMKYVCRAAV